MSTYIHTGIQVSPNSSRILRKLGIDEYIERFCTEPVDLRMMRWQDGTKLVECPLREPARNEYGSPYWCVVIMSCFGYVVVLCCVAVLIECDRHIHRADFHRGLSECAADLGIKTYLDSRVVEVDPETPALATKDARRFTADFVIAADGVHHLHCWTQPTDH
jgi:salicylate hydroxylase